jgi:hypothetical protein
MNNTMNVTLKPKIPCACGCGRTFHPRRASNVYFSRSCASSCNQTTPRRTKWGEQPPDTEHAPRSLNPDLQIPDDLSPQGKTAAGIILRLLQRHRLLFTGGCAVFKTPAAFEALGWHGLRGAELIICYDGGDAKYLCSLDGGRYQINEEMQRTLHGAGLYLEEGFSWCAGVYKITP